MTRETSILPANMSTDRQTVEYSSYLIGSWWCCWRGVSALTALLTAVAAAVATAVAAAADADCC